ncbi:MAG: helix-turn-helix domain-containing protein [Burkholderiales bacterium]|jgi:hypothetical protein|nr:helix-turn-helix domain-containing protein [Burkholderiales bacterium]
MSQPKESSVLRKMRIESGLNQAAFWTPLGITQSGGSRYEGESRRVPKPIAMLLTIAYGSEKDCNELVKKLRSKTQ